jgi:hypothetical protein
MVVHDTFMCRAIRMQVPRACGDGSYSLPVDLSGLQILDTIRNFESGPQAVGKVLAGRPGFEGIMEKLRGLCGCEDQ